MITVKINDLSELEKNLLLKYTVGGGLPASGWSLSVFTREFPTIHPKDLRKHLSSLLDYGYLSCKDDMNSFFFTDDGFFEANNYFKDEVSASRMQNIATNKTPNPSSNEKDWYDKPVGLIGIGIVITVLAMLANYLIKHYAGISS